MKQYAGFCFSEPLPDKLPKLEAFVCNFKDGRSQIAAFAELETKYKVLSDWLEKILIVQQPQADDSGESESIHTPVEMLYYPSHLPYREYSELSRHFEKAEPRGLPETIDEFLSYLAAEELLAGEGVPTQLPIATMKMLGKAHYAFKNPMKMATRASVYRGLF